MNISGAATKRKRSEEEDETKITSNYLKEEGFSKNLVQELMCRNKKVNCFEKLRCVIL
jgi:hypothetical protein